LSDQNEKWLTVLDELSNGFRYSQILFAAARLGVFEALGAGPLSVDQLAERLGCSRRGGRILCDALAGLGLLEKDGECFRHTSWGRERLCRSGEGCFSNMLLHKAALYERWGRLYDAVVSGRPVDPALVDPRLEISREGFARSMADGGRLIAEETAAALDLEGAESMLDIGGGPAVYAIAFARRNPRLRVTVLDDQQTLQTAAEYVAAASLGDRVLLRAGSIFDGQPHAGFDAAFVSNVVHMYGPDENRALLARAADAVKPGGRVCVKDFFLDENRTSPPRAAVFAVNMLINTENGDCYTVREVMEWLRASGLERVEIVELSPPNRMLVARRGG